MKLDVEKDVYISNVIKCCTLQNRHPLKSEINSCKRFLYSQIELVKPSIIIALGKFASQSLLNVDQPLNKLRGVQHFFKNIPVVVTFDPSYLLRNSSAKKEAWIDLQLALQISSNLA